MTNRDSIFGAKLIGHLQGNKISASTRTYTIPATDSVAVYMGDFVTHQADAALDTKGLYRPVVAQSAAADKVTGFVISITNSRDYENQLYRTASTHRDVMVCDDPYALFEIQADDTVTSTMVGLNADIVVGTGSTYTGLSGMELDVATVANTATLPLRIVGISPRIDNELGLHTVLICMMNYTTYKNTTGV